MAQQGSSTWTILFVVLFGGVGFLLGRVTAPHAGGSGHGCKKHAEACSHHGGHGSHEGIAAWCDEGGEEFRIEYLSSHDGNKIVEALVDAGFEGDTIIHMEDETTIMTIAVKTSGDADGMEVIKEVRVITEELEEK